MSLYHIEVLHITVVPPGWCVFQPLMHESKQRQEGDITQTIPP